jgi:hypothetical protein
LTGAPYLDPATNRLARVRVSGSGLSADVAEAITGITMSFSASQVGQLSMALVDTADAAIIRSGVFRKNTALDYADQHLEVRGLDITPGGGGAALTVLARSRVIGVLRGPEHTSGAAGGTWGEQDVPRWVADRCREAGATALVQPHLGSLTLTRAFGETTWDTMQTAARQTGCWCFEYEQVIVFGRPSWLADKRRRWWDVYWNSYTDYTPGLTGMPSYSWSDDGTRQESMSFASVAEDADEARPGHAVTVRGNMGEGVGEWVVTQVDVPGKTASPVTVTCSRIVDPKPDAVAVAA